MGINRGHTPLNNLLVRQAIAHAINKASLISTLYGSGDQAAAQFLPPPLMGYKTSITDYGYDPALAQNLLARRAIRMVFQRR